MYALIIAVHRDKATVQLYSCKMFYVKQCKLVTQDGCTTQVIAVLEGLPWGKAEKNLRGRGCKMFIGVEAIEKPYFRC